jgi:hypothetical protein
MIRYGYDHCRMCGIPIVIKRASALKQWENAQRKPPVPEKVWRDMGFLAAPTEFQMNTSPADGCCADCGMIMQHRKWHYHTRGVVLVAMCVIIAICISYVVLYMRH